MEMVLNVKGFPRELHRQAKIRAATDGVSLKEVIIRALTEYLEKKGE
jgi:predicted HicB family RNase H-like nuclease